MPRYSLLTIALLTTSASAYAQQPPPGAGGQLQQIPPVQKPSPAAPDIVIERGDSPPTPLGAGERVRVNAVRVTGNSLFSEAQLIAVANLASGSDADLSQLRQAAARISSFYNKRGYFLAQAYLPAQNISDGTVTITVIEGRYGAINLRNQAKLSDRVASDIVDGLQRGDIVAAAPLERRLLLLSDIPGVRVKSTLAPGTETGTSDLTVDLTPGRRISGSVEADNGGNRYTGTYRAGGTVNFNNPTGLGDMVSLRLLASTGGLAYGRASYQLPVGDATFGVAYTHLRYELGREFDLLEAEGTADILSAFASYPLIRSRDANLYALVALDAKWLEDKIDLFASESDKTSRVLTVGISGNSHDDFGGGGWNHVSAGLSFGDLHIKDPLERAIDSLTARSEGGFGKLALSASRVQTIKGPFSLYGAIRGQIAFDNLDSSEKMELGGAQGVRAYPEGEAYGDEGYIATAEARLMLGERTASMPGQFQLFGFVDTGEVDYSHRPWFAGSNHARRSGIGAGVTWFGPNDFLARATYAHRLGDQVSTSGPDKSGRFWFQIAKLF